MFGQYCKVPCGPTILNPDSIARNSTPLLYNEYIVFDQDRIRIKFIVHCERSPSASSQMQARAVPRVVANPPAPVRPMASTTNVVANYPRTKPTSGISTSSFRTGNTATNFGSATSSTARPYSAITSPYNYGTNYGSFSPSTVSTSRVPLTTDSTRPRTPYTDNYQVRSAPRRNSSAISFERCCACCVIL